MFEKNFLSRFGVRENVQVQNIEKHHCESKRTSRKYFRNFKNCIGKFGISFQKISGRFREILPTFSGSYFQKLWKLISKIISENFEKYVWKLKNITAIFENYFEIFKKNFWKFPLKNFKKFLEIFGEFREIIGNFRKKTSENFKN